MLLKPSQTILPAHSWQAQALLSWPAQTQPLAFPQVLLLLLCPLLRLPVLMLLGQLRLQRELLLLLAVQGCPAAQRCWAAQMADFQGVALLNLAAQQLCWQPLLQPRPDWPICVHIRSLHSIAMRTPYPYFGRSLNVLKGGYDTRPNCQCSIGQQGMLCPGQYLARRRASGVQVERSLLSYGCASLQLAVHALLKLPLCFLLCLRGTEAPLKSCHLIPVI